MSRDEATTALGRPALPLLIAFGGLPATGKTTLSRELARRLGAVYLRIDTVEQMMRNAGAQHIGPAGYMVSAALAQANLANGLTVVADCVNPVQESRMGWSRAAEGVGAILVNVHVVCSDSANHRRRAEQRKADIEGHRQPTWQEIVQLDFQPWSGDVLVIDTAHTSPDEAVVRIEEHIRQRAR